MWQTILYSKPAKESVLIPSSTKDKSGSGIFSDSANISLRSSCSTGSIPRTGWLVLLFTLLSMQIQAQQSNYHFSHTDSTTASPEKIWKVWTDVPNWKNWDKGLKDAFIEGEFKLGAKGKLIPDKGPVSKFFISEFTAGKSYSFKTKVPFGWLIIQRSLEVRNNRTYFTHDVQFTGPLKKILGNKLGTKYRAMLPSVLAEIKKTAESI